MTKPSPTLRKAAILIASLDDRTAQRLLNQMGPVQAERVLTAVDELDDIDPDEQEAVIAEFCRGNGAAAAEIGRGVELTGSLSHRFAPDQSSTTHSPSAPMNVLPTGVPSNAPFRFLHEANSAMVTPYLEREHPQTIAVVLSHLPPEKAADVIGRFSTTLQADVLRRLANLDEADPAIVREIEQSLERWVSEQTQTNNRREAGLVAVRKILQAAGTSNRELLTNLAKHDQEFAGILQGNPLPAPPRREVLPLSEARVINAKTPRRDPMLADLPPPVETWSFADLVQLNDADLATVFQATGTELTLLALTAAPPAIVERIVQRLPRREAKLFRKSLLAMGPTRLSDVEKAQQEIAAIAHRLADEGRIHAPHIRPLAAA